MNKEITITYNLAVFGATFYSGFSESKGMIPPMDPVAPTLFTAFTAPVFSAVKYFAFNVGVKNLEKGIINETLPIEIGDKQYQKLNEFDNDSKVKHMANAIEFMEDLERIVNNRQYVRPMIQATAITATVSIAGYYSGKLLGQLVN
jgi:hypothetical protein